MTLIFRKISSLSGLLLTTVLLLVSCDPTSTKLTYKIIEDQAGSKSGGCDIEIPKRYSKYDLISIATEMIEKHPNLVQYKVDFWLKGQVRGKQFNYAFVFYPPSESGLAKDKDKYDVPIEFEQTGLDEAVAYSLRAIKPVNPQNKTILGKFINDISKQITIIYTDKREKQGQIFIADYYLDNPLKPDIVSPQIKDVNGETRWIYDTDGNYLILKNNTLCHYYRDSKGVSDKCTTSEPF